jgi:hypothetical protein
MVAPCGGCCPSCGGGVDDKYCELPEQPANNPLAVASKPTSERRRVSKGSVSVTADA